MNILLSESRIMKLFILYLTILSMFLLVISCSEDEGMQEDPCDNGPAASLSVTPSTIDMDNGSIEVDISGGTPPYEVSVNSGAFQTGTTIEDLAPGNYEITVRDAEGCTTSNNATIDEVDPCANGPQASAETTASFDNDNTGTITISATGGTPPYSYKLDDNDFVTNEIFEGVAAGSYTITVRDNNDCTTEVMVDVGEVPFVSYNNDIKTIIETNCLLSGCHGDNSSIPDWGNLSTLQANADQVKTRTGNKSMPPAASGKSLTDNQIQQIANWVDAGAPNN